MTTSSPGSSTASSVESIASVEPQQTVTCAGLTATPYRLEKSPAIASAQVFRAHVIGY
jgi:hypothetical protein